MAGRECQGYFYKRLQRYQQCGAGAEIPIFADDIPLTRVPANESECQQAQEGRRKQRQMVIKQVGVSDLGRHRSWADLSESASPAGWAAGCWVGVEGEGAQGQKPCPD